MADTIRQSRKVDNSEDKTVLSVEAAMYSEAMRAEVERLITEAVGQARENGASWAQIGSAMGISAAGAHRKYREDSPRTGARLAGPVGDRLLERLGPELPDAFDTTLAIIKEPTSGGPEIG